MLLTALAIPRFASVRAAQEKRIALTFDDGPWPETTEKLLDGLAARGAHATFFLIGEQIEGNEALLRRMRDEGHQVGNHTFSHVRLDQAPSAGIRELQKTDALLKSVLGEGEYWIRPPWGFLGKSVQEAAEVPLVYWSVDTEDWQIKNADTVVQRIIENAQDGDIVLLHDPYPTSVEAALKAIDRLQEEGYVFVTVGELFDAMGIKPEAGTFYRRPDRKK